MLLEDGEQVAEQAALGRSELGATDGRVIPAGLETTDGHALGAMLGARAPARATSGGGGQAASAVTPLRYRRPSSYRRW